MGYFGRRFEWIAANSEAPHFVKGPLFFTIFYVWKYKTLIVMSPDPS